MGKKVDDLNKDSGLLTDRMRYILEKRFIGIANRLNIRMREKVVNHNNSQVFDLSKSVLPEVKYWNHLQVSKFI